MVKEYITIRKATASDFFMTNENEKHTNNKYDDIKIEKNQKNHGDRKRIKP